MKGISCGVNRSESNRWAGTERTGFRPALLLFVLWALLLSQTRAQAVDFTVSPATITSDYAGALTIFVTGLTNGQTILLQRYPDFSTNGTISADAVPFQSFTVTDGVVPTIQGEPNPNQPGDEDGQADGQMRIVLSLPWFSRANFAIGPWLIRVSSPDESFASIDHPFVITGPALGQAVQGSVTDGTNAQPFALVEAATPGTSNVLAAVFADASGAYSLPLAPGNYQMTAFKLGFVTASAQAPVVSLTTTQNVTQDLTVASADRAIDGQLRDHETGIGIPGISLRCVSTNQQLALAHSGPDGAFHIPVLAGIWMIQPAVEDLAAAGYCGLISPKQVDVTSTNTTNTVISLPLATAALTGTVRDNLNRSVANLALNVVETNLNLNAFSRCDPFGNYFLALTPGQWELRLPISDLLARGYLGSSSNLTVQIATNQVFSQDLAVQRVSAHAQGWVVDESGTGVASLDLTANGPGGLFSAGRTDQYGSFNLGLTDGQWLLAPDESEVNQRGFVSTNATLSVTSGMDQTGILLVLAASQVAPPPTPPSLTALRFASPTEFLILFSGDADRNYRIETSTNLLEWSVLSHFSTTGSTVIFTDDTATNAANFYRAIVE